jgi:hypothetical protein
LGLWLSHCALAKVKGGEGNSVNRYALSGPLCEEKAIVRRVVSEHARPGLRVHGYTTRTVVYAERH